MPSSAAAHAVSLPGERYGAVTQGLHWLAALVILGTWTLGISLETFPKGPVRVSAVEVHTLLGLTVLTLAVLRILSRLVTTTPEALGPAWLDRLARLGHAALYAVTVALPVSGLLVRWSARGNASVIGGWNIPAPFPIPFKDFWAETHEVLAYTLAALVVGHVVAALWHQFVLRDDVLGRIVPARGR